MENFNLPHKRSDAVDPCFLGLAKRVDVTLRDGAFAVGFGWSVQEAIEVVSAAERAGCEYVEIGYLGGPPEAHGVSFERSTACVGHNLIERLVENVTSTHLLAMLHPTVAVTSLEIRAAAKAGLSGVRLVYHPSWEKAFRERAAQLKDLGLWVSVNIALASHYQEKEFDATVTLCESIKPDALYLADTSAGLIPTQLPRVLRHMVSVQPNVGVHMHNHLGLALANSIVAVGHGATLVDYSIGGLGRGAGNLQAEIWEALLAAQSGNWQSVVALVALKDHLCSKRFRFLPSVDWTRVVSGALNLRPPEEDFLLKSVGCTLDIGELAHIESVLTILQNTVGLKRGCAL